MTPLAELLADRIRRFGPLTFADYMRECLYHPVQGYYSKAESKRFADYYTSVDVHPIFARLLARQFAEMWECLERPAEFTLVEAGAGVGRFAAQVLDFCESKLPAFYDALKYVAVERSASRREQATVKSKQRADATHFTASAEVPAHLVAGCLFSNELVDALPVHRVVMHGSTLKEVLVGFRNGQFLDVLAPLSTCAISEYFSAQDIGLCEGQHAEAGLEACDWINEIGRRLERGYVLTIDYGHPASDLFDEHHMRGTLLAYKNHRASEEFYASPGEQQTAFLLALGQGNEFADLYDEGQSEAERTKARLQLKTLIHPEGMGERFQVLIQQKRVSGARLTGLSGIAPRI